jgi:N utilization substance protein B
MNRRRAARLAAVQALYQIDLTGGRPLAVIGEFVAHRLPSILEPFAPDEPAPEVDRDWFTTVVQGTAEAIPALDSEIATCLQGTWTIDRLGYLLRACLRAGAYELKHHPEVPTAAVIDEYVELSRGFLGGKEPGFVHAVLDRLAQRFRQPTSAG